MALSDCPRCWDTPCSCGVPRPREDRRELAKEIADALAGEFESLRKEIRDLGQYIEHE